MIRSEDELNRKFARFLLLEMNNQTVTLGFGVPEEEVLQAEKPMPYMSLFYLWDELNEGNRLMGTYLEKVTELDGTVHFVERDMPEPVKFYYQLDTYSLSQKNLVQLSTEISKIVKRRGSFFFDDDNSAVDIIRTDVKDFTRDTFRLGKTEERIFKRTYTFSLDCLYQPNLVPLNDYGIILDTDITVKDMKEYDKDYPKE